MATDIFITPTSGTVDFNNGVFGSVLGTIATMKVYDNLTSGNLSIQNSATSNLSGVKFLNRGNPGNVFEAYGTYGNLFTISDDLTDSIFSINNSAGLPVFDVYSNNSVYAGQYASGDFTISGNKIGIGTKTPSSKLQVIGTVTAPLFVGALTGNASTATTLATARLIGGVSFNGSADITLPGVNSAGNQNTSGSSASCTGNAVTSTSTNEIILTSLNNGTVSINNPRTTVYRNENGLGAALAYAPVLHVGGSDTMWQVQGTYGSTGNGTFYFRQGYQGVFGNWLTMLSSANYNSYSPTLTGTGASGSWGISVTGSSASCTGNAATATILQTARTIGGVSFNGSADINLPGVNTAGNQNTTGTASNVTGTVAIANGGTGATSAGAAATNLGLGTGNTPKFLNVYGERATVTSAASTTVNTQYNVTELTMSASITTLTLSNIQASTIVHMWTIVTVGNGVIYSITWPAAIKWPGGTAPTITATNAKRDIYQFVTYDGGTNIYAIIVGQNL